MPTKPCMVMEQVQVNNNNSSDTNPDVMRDIDNFLESLFPGPRHGLRKQEISMQLREPHCSTGSQKNFISTQKV